MCQKLFFAQLSVKLEHSRVTLKRLFKFSMFFKNMENLKSWAGIVSEIIYIQALKIHLIRIIFVRFIFFYKL
jgi:hypothetical protein